MSGLIAGLSIAGAFARDKHMVDAATPKPLQAGVIGAAVGVALFGGGGYLYENAGTLTDKAAGLFESKAVPSTESACPSSLPSGSEITLTRKPDGTTTCIVKAP